MSRSADITAANLDAIAARFETDKPARAITPLGRGLINDTFRVETAGESYVLQRINGEVFPHPEQIMANLLALSELLADADAGGLRIPHIVLTGDGVAFARDQAGALWRMMELIPDARNLAGIESAEEAQEVGRVLGAFHRVTAALPVARFGVSLPGFHDTPAYLRRLEQTASERRHQNAIGEAEEPLAFVDQHRDLAGLLAGAERVGRIRRRITHGDPKLDNILFSTGSPKALALIDLDTIQPGLPQHDLGDCLRSCCNRGGEGAPDPGDTHFDLEICEGILRGYAAETRGLLGAGDIASLYDAIRSVPFELGLRFLTDHLDGNRYFRIDYPGQNLLKARIQLALVADIEAKEPSLRSMIEEVFGGDGR
ncbi:phosphotransferase enzyme family protein [Thiocystis violacea]|uniref:phosphotransferase enzyme family protein n=1 Tax=Thiocystis violacea TaxID=13725 RepID=UPI001903A533|nr:aminoglycoside phosphotransferase family protein [Thiocystis violacea]MBK1723649.1 aminoglycoside phosphotransferase [Thiocystis violacea]